MTASRMAGSPPQRRWCDALAALLIFAVCLALYLATLAPSLAYGTGDGSEIATVAATLGLVHPTGYPLYTWLAFLFTTAVPAGDVAYRTNLASAVLGAGGVAILYLVARRLELERLAAAGAALLFGVSTTFWSQAVITEVYAPNVLLVALTLWLLLGWAARSAGAWSFAAFALAFGLSLGTHMSNLGFAPAFALFALVTDPGVLRRPRTIGLGLLAFLLGAAQFVWLPLTAHTIDPATHVQPSTLQGVYRFTFGAFAPLRFAFPVTALPGTVVTYLALLAENVGRGGIALGLIGMWALLWRHPARFWLLFGMYLAHLVFFTQLQVPDLDVFFIPSHLVFTLFVGAGIQTVATFGARRTRLVVLAVLALAIARTAGESLAANDRSRDTALADFYRNVFSILPRDSTLVGPRGIFGYELLHWRRVYGLRPDVTLPLDWPPPARTRAPDASLFTTLRVEKGQAAGQGPWGPPRGLLPEHAWYVPVLAGNRLGLVLSRADPTPEAFTAMGREPPHRVDHTVGGTTLLGYALGAAVAAPSPRVPLQTFWRVGGPGPVIVTTRVDDVILEAHDLLFGNLARYLAEGHPPVVVEAFDLVLPSYLERGAHRLALGVAQFPAAGVSVQWIDLGDVHVE